MTIHSLPEIGRVLRNAVTFNFKNPPEVIMNADSLLAHVEQLFDLLNSRNVEYVLVGGVALLTYVDGRNTQDIDLIMALPALSQVPEIKVESQDLYFARGKFGELQIDILLTKNPLFEKVARQYSTDKQFMERTIRCASVEGLILLKLFALPSLYRQGGFERVGLYENDIATLMQAFDPEVEPLLQVLSHHLNPTDIQEARSILTDVQKRIQRFRQAGK